jgi:hypothetical protein
MDVYIYIYIYIYILYTVWGLALGKGRRSEKRGCAMIADLQLGLGATILCFTPTAHPRVYSVLG